eukprot:4857006-Pleurochrysis_carterae.AAC.2
MAQLIHQRFRSHVRSRGEILPNLDPQPAERDHAHAQYARGACVRNQPERLDLWVQTSQRRALFEAACAHARQLVV